MKALGANLLVALLFTGGCAGPHPSAPRPGAMLAHLPEGRAELVAIRKEFIRRNPGYDLGFHAALAELSASKPQVLFVQSGPAHARLGGSESELSVGDIVTVRPGQALRVDPPVAALAFEVPEAPPAAIPWAVRPDWDGHITDTPGGCATETGAYRRILLTWERENGPYVFHALNAHRVRMTDSLTHYHPVDGGFDELYLVQMAQPAARVVTSRHLDRLTRPETVTVEEAAGLLETYPLRVGDVVYLPRGLVHRGLGGVLAQVITVPGFKPGAQFSVDPQLAAINRRLGLTGDRALPFNVEAAAQGSP